MPRPKAASVSAYIEAAPNEAKPHPRELRALLKQLAPSATEAIKWGSPDTIQLRYDQRIPRALIRRIAKYRLQNVKDGAKWMK